MIAADFIGYEHVADYVPLFDFVAPRVTASHAIRTLEAAERLFAPKELDDTIVVVLTLAELNALREAV